MLKLLKSEAACKKVKTQNKSVQKKLIVFVVDDDRDDRILAFSKLMQSNYIAEICPVPSANLLFTCFDKIGVYEENFDAENDAVILLDIHMPETGGIEALDYIRNHPVTADIPVILLSSDVTGERMYDAYALSVNGFLQKPLNIDDFDNIVESNYSWATL